MSSSCQSQSPEALSDPMPRIYACFCQKLFTTYPGIYLHLKSKHGNLFQKYKRLKITKLFKKTRDQKGSEIYRLERLSERDGSQNFIYQKKIKQNTKKNDSEDNQDNNNAPSDIRTYQLRKKNNIVLHQFNTKKQPQNQIKFQQNLPRPYPDQFENQMPYPNPYMNFPFGMPPPFPPMFHQFPPMFPQMKISLKKVIQRFLIESDINDKETLKTILYDLVIFIDKNYDSINDPRTNGRLFLSYCDDYDSKNAGTILHDYIENKRAYLNSEELEEPILSQKSKEIEALISFEEWAINVGYIEFPMKQQQAYKEPSQNQKYQEQMNFSTTKTEKNNNKNAEVSEVIEVNSNE